MRVAALMLCQENEGKTGMTSQSSGTSSLAGICEYELGKFSDLNFIYLV